MRERDIQILLEEHLKFIRPMFTSLGGNNSDFGNKEAVRRAATALESVQWLGEKAQALLRLPHFSSPSTVLPSDNQPQIFAAANDLSAAGEHVLEFLHATLPKAPELYLSVRLPLQHPSLDENKKLLERLYVALDHPQRLLGHPPLRVSFVDVGSISPEIAVGSLSALTVVGSLLKIGLRWAKLKAASALADQEKYKAEQEKVRVSSEIARAEQEEAKADQEAAKARLAELGVIYAQRQLEFEIKSKELEFKKKELELDELMAQAEFERLALGNAGPNEVVTALRIAAKEIAELSAEGTHFRAQLDASADARRVLPAEVLPNEAAAVTPKALPVGSPIVPDGGGDDNPAGGKSA